MIVRNLILIGVVVFGLAVTAGPASAESGQTMIGVTWTPNQQKLLRPATTAKTQTPAESQTVVIQAWASWCMSCSTMIPLVQDALKKSASSATMVTVSIDENREDAEGYLRKHAALFTERDLAAYVDTDGALLQKFSLKAVPATIVVTNGKAQVLYGFDALALERALAQQTQAKTH